MPPRTLQKAFARELTPAEIAAWSSGENARRAADVYLRRRPARRGQVWEADHTQLPVLVLPPRGPAVRPWLTTIIDDGTRVLAGWALALTPHAGTVLTALRMALVHDPGRGPSGAVPAEVRVDRGLEFAAGAVGDALAVLCVTVTRLPGYSPHRKGKIERLHRTMDSTLLCGLPGFTGGPRDAAGKLYGPLDDRAAVRARAPGGAAAAPMRIELLAARFAAWADWYNNERAHSGLDGRTPVQAWQDDPSPVQRISDGELRHLLLAGEERVIGRLVLRADVSGDPTFADLVGRVRETDLASYAHQDVPFERLVEALNPARSLARQPLFQVMLSFNNTAPAALRLPGLTIHEHPAPHHTAKFDLGLDFGQRYDDAGAPAGMPGLLTYAADLFDRATAETISARLLQLLGQVAADPDVPVARLDVLLPGEREQLLAGGGSPP